MKLAGRQNPYILVMILGLTLMMIGTLPIEQAAADEKISPRQETSISLAEMSGLVMQPIYVIFRIPVAVTGLVASGLVYLASGGNERAKRAIWDSTVGVPWGWPEIVRGKSENRRH